MIALLNRERLLKFNLKTTELISFDRTKSDDRALYDAFYSGLYPDNSGISEMAREIDAEILTKLLGIKPVKRFKRAK